MTLSSGPTRGQQRILQLCCRTNWQLVGSGTAVGGTLTFELRERTDAGLGRVVQTITPQMVSSLVDAGWIEAAPDASRRTGSATRWLYRLTQAGIAAAHGASGGSVATGRLYVPPAE